MKKRSSLASNLSRCFNARQLLRAIRNFSSFNTKPIAAFVCRSFHSLTVPRIRVGLNGNIKNTRTVSLSPPPALTPKSRPFCPIASTGPFRTQLAFGVSNL